jgi:hypothetical protein
VEVDYQLVMGVAALAASVVGGRFEEQARMFEVRAAQDL